MIATPERPARRPPGRPPLTDRAEMLDAAVAAGFSHLTVATVTQAVGVKYSTFYRHFPSLDALLAAMVDAVLDGATWPADGLAWRPHLEQLAATLAGLVRGHPGLAEQLERQVIPDELRVQRARARGALGDAGVDWDAAWREANAVVRAAILPPLADGETEEDRLDPAELVPLVLDGIALRIGGQR